MLNVYYYFSSFMFFIGVLMFCFKCNHFLLMLLCLEFISLSLYFILWINLCLMGDYYFSMLFISMVVCEGALGLSLLVSLIRSYGNDYFQSLSILW
uniref:NADH-ubiquinone oxidoreductase chain 4L n=1 Tax=Elateroidea sp. 10 KM-2017 TaxID=2219424 RepID=A0A346RGZ9_9COLE|nr:NADH dehydrogenase subunit 4L [Elateroidea sp. 10 KM-2017]